MAAPAGRAGSGSSEPPMQKQARIKTSVVTRLEKELAKYHEEHDKQKAKIDGMRASGADEHDIKKQTEVLEETAIMIPDTMRRLNKGVEDLREFITANGGDASLIGSPLLAAAHETLARCGGDGGGADAAADDDAI